MHMLGQNIISISLGASRKKKEIKKWLLRTSVQCIKGAKKVRSAIKLCSYYFSYYVSNDINVTGIRSSNSCQHTWQEINNWTFIQIFCHRINYLQNQIPLGSFWAPGAKWRYITKNPCHLLAIVIRMFTIWSSDPKWNCYSSYISL